MNMDIESFSDWNVLPDVFGPPTAHSINRHRCVLECVAISGRPGETEDLLNCIDAVTQKRILCLREAGVK